MSTVGSRRSALALFRTLPELEPPLEFYARRVVQKMSPGISHSLIQVELGANVVIFARATKVGRVYSELRCTFGGQSHVPDLCFFARDRLPDLVGADAPSGATTAPHLAIEIRSPGQTVAELARKLRSAIRRGVRLGWLIDEKTRRVHVLRPTGPTIVLGPGETLAGEDILPGFLLPIDELFGWVANNQRVE